MTLQEGEVYEGEWQQLSEKERNDYLSTSEQGSFYNYNEKMRSWSLNDKVTDIGLEEGTILTPKYYNYPFNFDKCKKKANPKGLFVIKYADFHGGDLKRETVKNYE